MFFIHSWQPRLICSKKGLSNPFTTTELGKYQARVAESGDYLMTVQKGASTESLLVSLASGVLSAEGLAVTGRIFESDYIFPVEVVYDVYDNEP